jgi:hypothetical protein
MRTQGLRCLDKRLQACQIAFSSVDCNVFPLPSQAHSLAGRVYIRCSLSKAPISNGSDPQQGRRAHPHPEKRKSNMRYYICCGRMRIVRVLACMLHVRRQRDAAAMLIEGVSLRITSITQLSHAQLSYAARRKTHLRMARAPCRPNGG